MILELLNMFIGAGPALFAGGLAGAAFTVLYDFFFRRRYEAAGRRRDLTFTIVREFANRSRELEEAIGDIPMIPFEHHDLSTDSNENTEPAREPAVAFARFELRVARVRGIGSWLNLICGLCEHGDKVLIEELGITARATEFSSAIDKCQDARWREILQSFLRAWSKIPR